MPMLCACPTTEQSSPLHLVLRSACKAALRAWPAGPICFVVKMVQRRAPRHRQCFKGLNTLRLVLLQGSQVLDSRVVSLAMTFIPTGANGGQVAQLEHQAQPFSPVNAASELQVKMRQDSPKPMQVGGPAD